MSYANASSSAVAEFVEEGLKATYAGVVMSTLAIAQGASNTNDWIKDNGQQIYDTAKESWPKMSADMKANFLSSIDQAADGVVALGDWITAGLDALGNVFKSDASNIDGSLQGEYVHSSLAIYTLSGGYSFKIKDVNGNSIRFNRSRSDIGNVVLGSIYVGTISGQDKVDQLFKDLKVANGLAGLQNALGYAGLSVTIFKDGAVINPGQESIYNHLDNWIRQRAQADHPEGKLGVYAPTEAWTTSGIRLGIDSTGTQLLTLPDGVPYDPAIHGDYSWRKTKVDVIDGAPAVLDPTTWDFVRPTDKTQVRPATIPEIADYVGTDIKTAEDIKNNTKPKEEDDTVVKPNGSLKNPTKKLVFTPLMMSATTMTKKFPFSVPWDLANQLKVFNVEPTTPKIEINAPSFVTIGGVSSGMVFDIDFKMFDPIASGIRWLLVIGFDIALILMLRKLLPE